MYSSMNLDKYIHLCSDHPSEGVDYLYCCCVNICVPLHPNSYVEMMVFEGRAGEGSNVMRTEAP